MQARGCRESQTQRSGEAGELPTALPSPAHSGEPSSSCSQSWRQGRPSS